VAKQYKAMFFCKFTRGTIISWRIFRYSFVLTITKSLPFGQWQHAIGMLLVNLSNTKGMLLVNLSNLQNTRHAVLIIYKSYITCFRSGATGTQWLSHHWSIRIGIYFVYLALLYRKTWLHIVKPHAFCF
jgi:hypothetical protein